VIGDSALQLTLRQVCKFSAGSDASVYHRVRDFIKPPSRESAQPYPWDSWRADLISGFLVFLIALPLCLGIALACGFPAIAGIFTAIIGGILTPVISNSQLTIKGPAAGLIVVVVAAMQEFGFTGGKDLAADFEAYRMALAVGVVAGLIQLAFGLFRTGILTEFFPTAAVHGMLAAIGVIIFAKQVHVLLGVKTQPGTPFELLAEIPHSVATMNPEIATIGILSLIILFGMPLVPIRTLRVIPAQLLVLLVAVPIGLYFDLDHEHTYSFSGHVYQLGPQYLVDVPSNMFRAVTLPNFEILTRWVAWKHVAMYALVGSLESLLSAKAIDLLDPWRRKTHFDRDLIAVGACNSLAACIGGLPMISEIVRSKANIDNGARTKMANVAHGMFLLLFVSMVPGLIHRVPLAALGAMLVYTGFRLASPREFLHAYKIGFDQFVVFVVTILTTLATDLLVGVGAGIVTKLILHLIHGVPLISLFRPGVEIEDCGDGRVFVNVKHSAVFSTWLGLRRKLTGVCDAGKEVIVDLSQTRLVDHTVIEKLHQMQRDFELQDSKLTITGLDHHRPLLKSKHPAASRIKPKPA
jgi:MFS superfamily sulfate permease-like transporter